eukprot:TRINITY_DN40194_c0_g1_i1.p1 TRINITY_DN40194_c0_g1~~TRINITY_DN40194_c0_g1_i1.p1  ORF type:complete len:107 (+),score=1.43 TRINITY_DN40194_c0_g1_i1:135-455(+)
MCGNGRISHQASADPYLLRCETVSCSMTGGFVLGKYRRATECRLSSTKSFSFPEKNEKRQALETCAWALQMMDARKSHKSEKTRSVGNGGVNKERWNGAPLNAWPF